MKGKEKKFFSKLQHLPDDLKSIGQKQKKVQKNFKSVCYCSQLKN